jgi:hypothetical protein
MMAGQQWPPLAAPPNAKRQAPIDPRNYRVKNFPALFEAMGLFEIFKSDDGASYVADKRNTDRSLTPDQQHKIRSAETKIKP